jgi:hypothetical protein
VVVLPGETERLFPLPISVPPHEPVYQLKVVPEPPVYCNEVDCPAQIVVDVAVAEVGATGSGLTVIVTDWQVDVPHPLVQAP